MEMQLANFSPIKRLASALSLGAILLGASAMVNAGTIPPFDIGGDIPDEDCLTGVDCIQLDDPFGNSKELGPDQGSDTKLGVIHTAIPPMLGLTNPNGQNDLVRVWLKSGVDLDGDVWLYLAWERDSNKGTSVITYEFHGDELDAACDYSGSEQNLIDNCNPWANRAAGDFLVVYDFQGGSSEIIIRNFDGSAFDAGTNVTQLGYAQAELNGDSSRGEAAINLTDSLFSSVNTCVTVANVIPGTITGNSDTADYKDTVLADSGNLNVSNCGTVKVTKTIDPNSLNQDGTFNYTLDRADGSDIRYGGTKSIPGDLIHAETDTLIDLLVGNNYQISEDSIPADFEKLSIICDQPASGTNADADTVPAGAFSVKATTTTNCTITNKLKAGQLTVVKEVENNFGGTATASDFCISLNDTAGTADFNGSDAGTDFTFVAGNSYDVDELDCSTSSLGGTTPPGYGQKSKSADCAGTINADDSKTCTIVNEQLAQTGVGLTLFKELHNDFGGTKTTLDWTLSASLKTGAPAVCTNSGFNGKDGDDGNGVPGTVSVTNSVATCTYELAESPASTPGYTSEGWSCSGDVTLTNGNEITVGPNGGSCTIVNRDIQPKLTLVKTVSNNFGGLLKVSDFPLFIDATPATSGQAYGLNAGNYTASETQQNGYAASDWGGDCAADGSVTLSVGDDKTCTITNSDIQPKLTLVKTVSNNFGGLLKVSDFPLFIDATPATSGQAYGLNAGNYTASETQQNGYAASDWGGDCAADGSVTLSVGDDKTCTITNSDIQPKLTLVKTVSNNFGGLLKVSDFPLFIDATPATSGQAYGLNAGNYTASETQQNGYAASDWGGDCAADGSVTLSVGDDKTCTITNSDIQPKLTLVKTVDNNFGGLLKVSDFPLFIDATPATSGQAYGLNAGNYTASETQQNGYAASDWGGDCAADGSVTLSVGDDKTCTITNSDIQPKLTLVKTVDNNFGGLLKVSDFPLFIDATPATSGQAYGLNAGNYTASETQQNGYAASDWGGDCAADGSVTLSVGDDKTCTITNSDIQPKLTLVKTVDNNFGGLLKVSDFPLFIDATPATSGQAYGLNAGNYTASETQQNGYAASDWGGDCAADGSVTLSVGDDKTCTITNSDIQPKLTLVKTVDNNFGGLLKVSDFPLFIDATPATSGQAYGLNAGNYTASETQQNGYAASDWGGDCAADGSVTLSVGDDKTCTITNSDIQPKLTLVKTVDNNFGGLLKVSDFPLFISGSPATSGVAVPLSAGNYTASETQQFGYTTAGWGGDCAADGSVTLSVGDNKTCTITNTDLQPTLKLVKTVNNNFNGPLGVSDFPLFISGSPATSGVAVPLSAGNYTASETQQFGYTASSWGGDCDASGNVSLSVGQNKTCTITNSDIQPTLTLVKTVSNLYGGTLGVANFPLFIDATPATSGQSYGLNAGNYTASETQQDGYVASAWGGDCDATGNVTLAVGQNKTCTITNTDIPPQLLVVKTPDGGTVAPGGTAQFTITVYNIGGGDALGVTLDDTLPSPAGLEALTWNIVSQSGAACVMSGDATLDCNIGTLVKDPTVTGTLSGDEASYEVQVAANIPSDYFAPGSPPALDSVFEIDGDMVKDLPGTAADWDVPTIFNKEDPPLVVVTGISQDDSFGKGSKEDDAVPSIVDSSVPPNKSDLTNFIGVTDLVVDGNVVLAIGWLRNNELGTSSFDFELNQDDTVSGNGVTPLRTIGDWLLGFDFSSGGDNVSLTLREWDGSVWGPATTLDASVALGAVNDPVTFGTSPNNEDNILLVNGKLIDNTFGEALINLTAAFPGGGCRNFASAFVKGRSSDSFTSALKDFIAPVPVDIDTCQTVDLPNTATADTTNPGGSYGDSDTGSIGVSNVPSGGGS